MSVQNSKWVKSSPGWIKTPISPEKKSLPKHLQAGRTWKKTSISLEQKNLPRQIEIGGKNEKFEEVAEKGLFHWITHLFSNIKSKLSHTKTSSSVKKPVSNSSQRIKPGAVQSPKTDVNTPQAAGNSASKEAQTPEASAIKSKKEVLSNHRNGQKVPPEPTLVEKMVEARKLRIEVAAERKKKIEEEENKLQKMLQEARDEHAKEFANSREEKLNSFNEKNKKILKKWQSKCKTTAFPKEPTHVHKFMSNCCFMASFIQAVSLPLYHDDHFLKLVGDLGNPDIAFEGIEQQYLNSSETLLMSQWNPLKRQDDESDLDFKERIIYKWTFVNLMLALQSGKSSLIKKAACNYYEFCFAIQKWDFKPNIKIEKGKVVKKSFYKCQIDTRDCFNLHYEMLPNCFEIGFKRRVVIPSKDGKSTYEFNKPIPVYEPVNMLEFAFTSQQPHHLKDLFKRAFIYKYKTNCTIDYTYENEKIYKRLLRDRGQTVTQEKLPEHLRKPGKKLKCVPGLRLRNNIESGVKIREIAVSEEIGFEEDKILFSEDLPKIMVLDFKRFEGDDFKDRKKNNAVINFEYKFNGQPNVIDLTPYVHEPKSPCHYQIVSATIHSGGLEGGHYVAIQRVDNDWYLQDDQTSETKKLSLSEVKKYLQKAYFVVCEKVDTTSLATESEEVEESDDEFTIDPDFDTFTDSEFSDSSEEIKVIEDLKPSDKGKQRIKVSITDENIPSTVPSSNENNKGKRIKAKLTTGSDAGASSSTPAGAESSSSSLDSSDNSLSTESETSDSDSQE